MARDALLAAASEAPILGAIIGFVANRAERVERDAFDQTLRSFERELRRLASRVTDQIEVGSRLERQFSEVLMQVSIISRRSRSEIKLGAAGKLWANALLRDGDPECVEHGERQLFLNAIESVSDAALVLLARVHNGLSVEDRQRLSSTLVRVDFGRMKRHLVVDDSLLMALVGELDRFNLFHKLGSPGLRSGLYDNYPIEITPLAARFVPFIVAEPT